MPHQSARLPRALRPVESAGGLGLAIVVGLLVSHSYPRLGFFILILPFLLAIFVVLAIIAFLTCGAFTGDVRRGFKVALGAIVSLFLCSCAFVWWYCLAGLPIHERSSASPQVRENVIPQSRPQATQPTEKKQSLRLFEPEVNRAEKRVFLNGVDAQRPTIPFTFEWGDGSVSTGFFPQVKTYPNIGKLYQVRVFATHNDGSREIAVAEVDLR